LAAGFRPLTALPRPPGFKRGLALCGRDGRSRGQEREGMEVGRRKEGREGKGVLGVGIAIQGNPGIEQHSIPGFRD